MLLVLHAKKNFVETGCKRSYRVGFTLIELLVVIAIIAILAAILFPVFSRVREKARSSKCLSNIKQTALAVLMYSQDYDEMFPGWRLNVLVQAAPCLSSDTAVWYHHLAQPYVKNWQLFICPSTRWEHGKNCGFWISSAKPYGTSYAFHCHTGGVEGQPIIFPQIRRPSDLAMIADGVWGCLRPWRRPNGGCGTDYIEPHTNGVNVAFFDGHTKWMSSQKFWAPDWNTMRTYLPWYNSDSYPPYW